MSNMPSTDKTRITLRMDVRLRAKLKTLVRRKREEEDNPLLSEQDVALRALDLFLKTTEPDEDDLAWAANEKRKNSERRRGSAGKENK